jgi:hypothetical protein
MMKRFSNFSVIVLSLLTLVSACSSTAPKKATYTEWDRAIRVDTDLHNMFGASPTKINEPIDMYMAMSLAIKSNYTLRVVEYEKALKRARLSSKDMMPEVVAQAGYTNSSSTLLETDLIEDQKLKSNQIANERVNTELKLAWNILDLGSSYYQANSKNTELYVQHEKSRKVIHNLLQAVRVAYWKALNAQRLIPVVDTMIESITLQVDELNSVERENKIAGIKTPTDKLIKKRNYILAANELKEVKLTLESSEVELASLMGLHPATEYKLVGIQYGNFSLPEVRTDLSKLEWLALMNRPEIRQKEVSDDIKNIKKSFKKYANVSYEDNPKLYNKVWSKKAKKIGMELFEDRRNPNNQTYSDLQRQRMSMVILSQLYVAWGRYLSAYEDYQIKEELANVSEDIAHNVANKFKYSDATLAESAKSIIYEVQASLAYANLQEALGNLYVTIGLDALPNYMINEKLSKIAISLRETMEKWSEGSFSPSDRPHLLSVPSRKPPMNITAMSGGFGDKVFTVQTGQNFRFKIDEKAFKKAKFKGLVSYKAGLINDSPLPKWISFSGDKLLFSGLPMPDTEGYFDIKIYGSDEAGKTAYLVVKVRVIDSYVPSVDVFGLTPDSKATVMKQCEGKECPEYVVKDKTIGKKVSIAPVTRKK